VNEGVEEAVTFESDGVPLAGLVALPAGLGPGERRPAIIIMHGFGGHKDGPQQRWSVRAFTDWGYVTLRFDFRGCGDSGGERGRVLPHDQVADARAAVGYMAARREVDANRIALSGTSYGATVAIYAAGIDKAVGAVIAQGGWANGERMFRCLHSSDDAWRRFNELLARGRAHRQNTGDALRVHRFDIIPLPERLRKNVDGRSIYEFPVDTAEETLSFNAEDVVARIAPRPLLLVHSALDEVIAARCSIELFARAGQPTDLHVFSGVDHFMFGENDPRVINVVRDWLARSFPAV